MRRAPRSTAAVALLAVVVAATGCDIPVDESAEPLAGGVIVPALDPAAPAPPADDSGVAPETGPAIFLVAGDRIVDVPRRSSAEALRPVLDRLLDGPTEAEFAAGVRTAIPPETRLRSAVVDGDTAVIDLTSAFVEVGGEEQILAVAQFVLTATALPEVARVGFALDGQAVEVPRADGTLTRAPLTAADFASLCDCPDPDG